MTPVNIFLVNLTSTLLQCTLHILDYFWVDIFDIKRIQNVTSFLWTFYVAIILRFGDFALTYAFVCISNIVMFPENEKVAV